MTLNYIAINNRINIFLQSLRPNTRRIILHIRKAAYLKIPQKGVTNTPGNNR